MRRSPSQALLVHERARDLARAQAAAVEQTMRLEGQATGRTSELEDQLALQLLERGGLWRDIGP